MLPAALAWLCGILLALYGPSLMGSATSAMLWAIGCVALALGWRWRARRHWRWLALLPVGLAAFFHAQGRINAGLEQRWPDQLEAVAVSVQAHIVELPRQLPDRWSFVLQLDQALERDEGRLAAGSRLSVNWYRAELDEPLRPGDCAQWQLQLRGLRGPVNVAGWEPERQALLQRRSGRASVSARGEACRTQSGLDRWRSDLAERVDRILPPSSSRASLKALTIGDTREFGEREWDGLRATGLTHLMAISGLHIGLLAGFGVLLVRLLYRLLPALGERWPRPLAEAVLALLLATTYAALAGFSLPTQRALAALAAFLGARLLRRNLGVWSAFGLALLVVLLLDPLAPLGAGFWLSFGAVAWLLYGMARGGPRVPAWRGLLQAQLLLSLALAPITAWWFGQGSLLGPLLNLLVVPWVALVAVPANLLALALSVVWPGGADWPLQYSAQLLRPLWWLLEQAGGSAAPVGQAAPTLLAVVLASLGVAWLFAPAGVRGRALGLLLWLPLLWPARPQPPVGALWLQLLDVGQGQAVLIRTASHALLVDAGPAAPQGLDLGEAIVVPALRQLGVRQLDLLLLSHADHDHAGGRRAVQSAFAPKAESGQLPQPDERLQPCQRGQSWTWDNVTFEILHPPEHFPYLGNDSSCVLRIEDAAGGRVLIPGDIASIVEQRLLREQPEALVADVLVAAHHGSNGSSSAAFLAQVQPSQVLYSAGWGNRFNMPRPEVVDRVAATGARQWSTARSGALSVRSDGAGGFVLQRERALRAYGWRGADLGELESENEHELSP